MEVAKMYVFVVFVFAGFVQSDGVPDERVAMETHKSQPGATINRTSQGALLLRNMHKAPTSRAELLLRSIQQAQNKTTVKLAEKPAEAEKRRSTTIRRRGQMQGMFQTNIQWSQVHGASCLWDPLPSPAAEQNTLEHNSSEHTSSEHNSSYKFGQAENLDDCKRACVAQGNCVAVHWFFKEKTCMFFDRSCDLKPESTDTTGRITKRWQKPDWFDELMGQNEVWVFNVVTETLSTSMSYSYSYSVSLPTQSASSSDPSMTKTNLPPSRVGALGQKVPSWVDWLPVPVAEIILVVTLVVCIGVTIMRCVHKRQRIAEYTRCDIPEGQHSGYMIVTLTPEIAEENILLSSSDAAQKPSESWGDPPRRWQRGKLLGRGSYGKVYLGVLGDGSLMAVKVLPLPEDTGEVELRATMREVETLCELAHPRVVRCYGCHYDPTESELHVFMEYMHSGSLGKLVRALGKKLEETAAASYVEQIVDGIAHLHSRGMVHRDLKGDNILLTGEGRAKIADFGACRSLRQSRGMSGPHGVVGTPSWMAPEALRSGARQSYPVDIWALGIIVCELLDEGKVPWPRFDHPMQACYMIARWKGELPPGTPRVAASGQPLSDDCIDFMKRALDPNPDRRWRAEELAKHPWLLRRAGTNPQPLDQLGENGGAVAVRHGGELCEVYSRHASNLPGPSGYTFSMGSVSPPASVLVRSQSPLFSSSADSANNNSNYKKCTSKEVTATAELETMTAPASGTMDLSLNTTPTGPSGPSSDDWSASSI